MKTLSIVDEEIGPILVGMLTILQRLKDKILEQNPNQ